MTFDALNDLLISYEQTKIEMLFDFDIYFNELFHSYFNEYDIENIPMYVLGFMEIDNWQGMAQRCGVWQYYESRSYEPKKLEAVINLLENQGEEEFVNVFASGIHDYANSEYEENFNYPVEWLEQSNSIDNWIYENERKIYQLKCKLIISNKDEILKLSE